MKAYTKESLDKLRQNFLVSDFFDEQDFDFIKIYECPFCNELDLEVFNEGTRYHCFGCGAHGDIVSFLMTYHQFTYEQAIEELMKISGIHVDSVDYNPKEITQVIPESFINIIKQIDNPLIVHAFAQCASMINKLNKTEQVCKCDIEKKKESKIKNKKPKVRRKKSKKKKVKNEKAS